MTVGVVIIAGGRHEHLRRTLRSLARQTSPADDVVVVDIGSRPPLNDVVEASGCTARCVRLEPAPERSLPLARARNLGVWSSSTADVILLDVDCIAAPGLVATYVDALERCPGALVCGPVRYLLQGWDEGDVDLDTLDERTLERRSKSHPSRPPAPPCGVRVSDDHESFWSLSFALRRSTWELLDGFDVGYVGYGGEDTDFGLRARALDVPMGWTAGAGAFHQWHPETRLDPKRADEIVANARRFRARWGWWPMHGWLTELHSRGVVSFEPENDRLERVPVTLGGGDLRA